mgnify:CR=1 FL=1
MIALARINGTWLQPAIYNGSPTLFTKDSRTHSDDGSEKRTGSPVKHLGDKGPCPSRPPTCRRVPQRRETFGLCRARNGRPRSDHECVCGAEGHLNGHKVPTSRPAHVFKSSMGNITGGKDAVREINETGWGADGDRQWGAGGRKTGALHAVATCWHGAEWTWRRPDLSSGPFCQLLIKSQQPRKR